MARWDELIKRLPQDRHIIGAEIGVWKGTTSRELLKALPQMTLLLVDRWRPPVEGDSYYRRDVIARRSEKEHADALLTTRKLLHRYGTRAKFMVGNSVDMAAKVEDESLDFVFIDGDHTFDGCFSDLKAWAPKVKPGGLIGGHDYDRPDKGDVTGAVKKFFGELAPIEAGPHHCWWLRRPLEQDE